jgi:hypothetical protein
MFVCGILNSFVRPAAGLEECEWISYLVAHIASQRRVFVFYSSSPQIQHINTYLPHRAILTGKMKVTMTTISWIHDPDTGMLASQRNVGIMRSTDSRIKREKSPKEAIRDLRYARSRKGSQ